MGTNFLAFNQPASLMHQLCKVKNAGEIVKSAACYNWFRQATAHCTRVMDLKQHTMVQRVASYLLPSFRKLHSFYKITEINADLLSESDCKLLLTKMSRDYVQREPHYKLAGYTLLALWIILILTVAIIALMTVGVLYTRFSAILKRIFDDKASVEADIEPTMSQSAENDENKSNDLNDDAIKIEEVLKYELLESEERVLSALKKAGAVTVDKLKETLKTEDKSNLAKEILELDEQTFPPAANYHLNLENLGANYFDIPNSSARYYEPMSNSMDTPQCRIYDLNVEVLEPLPPPYIDDVEDTAYL